MRRLRFVVVGMVLAGADGLLGATALSAQEIRIRDDVYQLWPIEDLARRGLLVEVIPTEQNAAWVYLEAVNRYVPPDDEVASALEHAVESDWPESAKPLHDLLAMAANRSAMGIVVEASRMERCQLPLFGDPTGSVLSAQLPNLTHLKTLGRMMIADGRRLLAEGDAASGVGRFLDVCRLSEHLGQGATLIEQLVAVSLASDAHRAIGQAVMRHDLGVTLLRHVDRRLAAHAARVPDVRRGLEGEKSVGPAIVDEVSAYPQRWLGGINISVVAGPKSNENMLNSAMSHVPQDGWDRLVQRCSRLFFPDRTIKRHMDTYYDRCLQRHDDGPVVFAERDHDLSHFMENEIPHWDVLSRILLPSLMRATEIGEEARARFTLLRAALRIRMHMAQNDGRWPAALSELLDDGESAVDLFADPFSETSIRYLPDSAGWTIYSLGRDLADDRGRPLNDGQRHRPEGDIVLVYPPENPSKFEPQER